MSIQEHLNKIRNAIYGREVRESIAKGIETAYNDASEKHDNANMEVKMARGTHPNLNSRLNKMDETDSQNTEKIDSNYNEVTTQLAQTVKQGQNESITKAMLAKEIKEDLNNGEIEFKLNTSEIEEGAVTYDKTNFADEVAVRVKNLIYNGNFDRDSDGDGIADGFTVGGDNYISPRIEGRTQYWTPLSTQNSGALRIAQSSYPTLIKGHVYYLSVDVNNVLHIDFAGGRIGSSVVAGGKFTTLLEYDENVTGALSFRGNNISEESSISNIVLVDLTETFGVGAEPSSSYFEHLLKSRGVNGWFDTVNLTDASKKPILSARDLNTYGLSNSLTPQNTNDVLRDLENGIVKAVSGKNIFNPEETVEGGLQTDPVIYSGLKQKIDKINNPLNYHTQKIKIVNKEDVTLSGVSVYAITDLSDTVIEARNSIGLNVTTIRSSDIPLEEYYLWVSVVPDNFGLAQVEMGGSATNYEPYTPVKTVYANGVKLFDFPLDLEVNSEKKTEIHNLAMAKLETDELEEKNQFLVNNAQRSNLIGDTSPSDTQTIPLTDTIDEQKMILHLHKREKEDGFGTYNNAYLPNAKDDFSDVRITTDNGEVLPYRTVYSADDFDVVPYDWEHEPRINSDTFMDSEGTLYQSQQYLRTSKDKGVTWTDIPAFNDMYDPTINLIAQDDTLYFNHDSKLYRSESPYTDYEMVFDLAFDADYGNVTIVSKGLVQHPDGDLFFGLYQDDYRINIFKSSDNGFNWELSADLGDKYQHVHGMYVDEYANPPAVYAGCDKGGGVLKTTDKGETWVDLKELYPEMPQSTDYGVRYADPSGYRLLGGETPIVGGHSIIKTYDDEHFYPVLSDGISVNYIVKLGNRLFATGSGSFGFRNGAIYISRDDGENWESVYRTSPILDTWTANDGYRHMEQISEDEILVGQQSSSRPPLRIFGSGRYAEIIVEVPEGTNSLTVESGHAYPNEYPIVNDIDFVGEKIVHFELNENSNVIKESVSGELFEGDFQWMEVGKHMSYFYPYITSPKDKHSVIMNTLTGYDIELDGVDVTEGITISFWSRLSRGTRLVLFENEKGDTLEIVNGYQLYFNNSYITPFNHPVLPEPFLKHDLTIASDGAFNVYTNGLLRSFTVDNKLEILEALSNSGKTTFLRGVNANDDNALQHFMIRKGVVSEEQLLKEYNGNVRDNIDE